MSQLSHVTKEYLSCYYQILDCMTKEMSAVKLTDSISHNFILQMIPHHEAAIKMCENLLRYTTDLCLQKMASNIIIEQKQGIQNMQYLLSECSMCVNKLEDVCLYEILYTNVTDTMFSDMKKACVTNNINCNFIREMIPHHVGAIGMCENVLRFPICKELIPIANSIIKTQCAGVKELNYLL
ncbi:MAG: DUF305 domain-containing protein [Eubacteriales bacterium]